MTSLGTTPYFSQVVIEVPYTAVTHGSLEHEGHVPVVHRLVGRGNHVFQEKIRFLEHIPEVKVVVREIESREVIFLDDART